jgi:hypothetical protein
LKAPKLRWNFTLESRAGRWAMAIVGCLFIALPLANVINAPDFYQPSDIRANPVFAVALWALFAVLGVALLYRAIKGPPYHR